MHYALLNPGHQALNLGHPRPARFTPHPAPCITRRRS